MVFKKQFEKEWEVLRSMRRSFPQFLEAVSINNLRGIKELKVDFDFPVSVLFGANACGKTTILQACACAYNVPDTGVKDFVPSTLFPMLRNNSKPSYSDTSSSITLGFDYVLNNDRSHMDWKKGATRWTRSFRGRKGAKQILRKVYFRSLASLTNPSEVRNYIQIGKRDSVTEEIPVSQFTFAHSVLPMRHNHVFSVKDSKRRELLFAESSNGSRYSEFQMSAGERAVLHLSRDLANIQDALVLIDEVEAGLHPYCQQMLMLELLRLARRNHLQIIVATHSMVIIESVPPEAKIFLDRQEGKIEVGDLYRPIIQHALYGQSLDKLSILCEDEIAESVVRGVFETINQDLNLHPSDVNIARDTGIDEFPQHAKALAKFKALDDFLFVVDGDASKEQRLKLETALKENAYIFDLLSLPGAIPEEWIWNRISEDKEYYCDFFGTSSETLNTQMFQIGQRYAGFPGHETDRIKGKFYDLAVFAHREPAELCRFVAQRESQQKHVDMKPFCDSLKSMIEKWLTVTH